MGHEGGYSNNPADSGGETYRGISRVHHPDWLGWEMVDGWKLTGGITLLGDDQALDLAVRSFYKVEFWDKIKGDYLASQIIADELFDTAVIMSPRKAVTFLQRCLNMLNNRQKLYSDIAVDGGIGPKTLSTLTNYLEVRSEGLMYTYLNVVQGAYFIERVEKREDNEAFARGWIENRVTITKV